MRFEYETKEDDRECVAYISSKGNLLLKNTDTGKFSIAICKIGQVHADAADNEPDKAIRKFYPGDDLTITF